MRKAQKCEEKMKARKVKSGNQPQRRAEPLRAKARPTVSEPPTPRPEDFVNSDLVQVTLRLRASLRDRVQAEAHARRTTMQSLILLGLRELGLPVTEDDLQDRRKPGGASSKSATAAARANGRRERRQERASHHGGPEHLIRLGLQALGEQNPYASGAPTVIVVSSGCRCG